MLAAPPNVLAIAASDPTGGAGLQADILTLASLGCHPLSVLTAYTVQDTRGVAALHAVPAADLVAQARCVLADAPVLAIKIGVVGSAANAQAIAELLAEHPQVPVVLDPVLASARGDELAAADVIEALAATIVPQSTVVTPNSIEARRLGGAGRLLELGCDYVLVTGTHEAGAEVINTLYDARGVVRETGRFIGAGVANLLNILNPDVVVLAGGVTRAGDELLVPLRAEVQRRAFQPAVDACRIVQGTLGVSAGVIGAAATFLAQHRAPE